MDTISFLERVKIQSEILLPLYRRLREELGADRANEIVRGAVKEYATQIGESARRSGDGSSLDKVRALVPMFTADNALSVESITNGDKEMKFNVTRCEYARYFEALGEPELGAMLTCEIDPPMTAAIGEDLVLERSQTIMGGAKVCDFRFKMR